MFFSSNMHNTKKKMWNFNFDKREISHNKNALNPQNQNASINILFEFEIHVPLPN